MEKSLWKVKYIQAPYILLIVVLRNGHTKGILYKIPIKRFSRKMCENIIKCLEEEVGTQCIGSCIVDEDMIKKATVIKEYGI